MKKILALIITAAMLLTMSVATFAKSEDFLVSPSKNLTPDLKDYEHEDHDCPGEIVIVGYGDKNTLSDDDKKEFEDAYNSIINADKLTDLNKDLTGDLAISDIFGVDLNGCDEHPNHGKTTIELDTDSAKNFHSLIAFDGEKWITIDATLNGTTLTFTTYLDSFTAFAIVVNTASDAPQTGDSFSWGYVALMAVAAAGIVVICISMKKKKG